MILLVLFAFLAGVVTILSPCILPILPLILSSSTGGHKKPFGIVTGFILSFTFFTLALTTIVKLTGIPSDTLRYIAVAIILFFGLSLIIPQTQILLEKLFTRFASFMPQSKNDVDAGFFSGIVIGVSLGIIWAPCVGPILASVITLAATSTITFATIAITFAYSLGTAIPMFVIIYSGQRLLRKMPWLLNKGELIQKIFGLLMVFTALAIFFDLDRQFQTKIIQIFPQYGAGLTNFENNSVVQNQLQQLRGGETSTQDSAGKLLPTGTKAADFTAGGNWINSQPLSLRTELKGKVVLVDFWTYSCINCLRTLPYLKQWYDTYKEQGFTIVGVHSPEFEFEKQISNVSKAVKDLGVLYPVVQDNDLKIWGAYQNQYWPAHYLIDKEGNIRYVHFGEGKYVETENAIRTLLDQQPVDKKEPAPVGNRSQTPETYLGYSRADAYSLYTPIQADQKINYSLPASVENDAVALGGEWLIKNEYIQSESDQASLVLNFQANQTYLVIALAAGQKEGKVKVLLDGKEVPAAYRTADMDENGVITVVDARKYDILNLASSGGRHTVKLEFSSGIQAFAFTFG
jgi:cytochrome c biogenesis protein CcdA/thiol-disulfide isomerase/thioredoxin